MADADQNIRTYRFDCGDRTLAENGFTTDAEGLVEESMQQVLTAIVERSVVLAEADKQPNFGREVTTQHVQQAINRVTGPLQRVKRPTWSIFANIFEYIFTIGAGAGLGNLDKAWGAGMAAVCGVLALVLLSFRHIYVERDR